MYVIDIEFKKKDVNSFELEMYDVLPYNVN